MLLQIYTKLFIIQTFLCIKLIFLIVEIIKTLILNNLKEYKKFSSSAEYARFLDVKPQVLSNWYKRNTFDINILVDKFPEINQIYLLTGEGEMIKSTTPGQKKEDQNFRLVPLYNMDARGGVDDNEETDTSAFVIDSIPFKDAKENDNCMPVSGNSMIPTFAPGSIVLLHEIEAWQEFLEYGQIYVIVLFTRF